MLFNPYFVLLPLGLLFLLPKANSVPFSPKVSNNNPGNIRATSIHWNGQIGVDGGFAVFENEFYGARAAYINLRSYFTNGFDTINTIIYRWAPPSDNNPTNDYAEYVALRTGYDINQRLSFTDDVAYNLLTAIFRFEKGIEFDKQTLLTVIENTR